MVSVLLTILKILGILLLVLLGTALVLLCLVLFVPVRYRVRAHRRMEEETPAVVDVKVSWLLHLVSAGFSWPENAFLRVRLLGITVFRSDKKKKEAPEEKEEFSSKNTAKAEKTRKQLSPASEPEKEQTQEEAHVREEEEKEEEKTEYGEESRDKKQGLFARLKEFLHKLLSLFQNIRYTIDRICDKIKHIGNNIRYYLKILKSETFGRAWTVCSGEAISLLRSILPGKITGSLTIGTGDPASTGQVLAVYGILYPLLGGRIDITPDFDRQVVEGELSVKGKITVVRGLKTAWRIYFNRDFRRLIKLLKREAA